SVDKRHSEGAVRVVINDVALAVERERADLARAGDEVRTDLLLEIRRDAPVVARSGPVAEEDRFPSPGKLVLSDDEDHARQAQSHRTECECGPSVPRSFYDQREQLP